MKEINMKNYIAFLIGVDDFEISKHIREHTKNNLFMDELYDKICHIADKFEIYDRITGNINCMDEYSSLEYFLRDYHDEILKFLDDDIDFCVKE